MKTIIIGRNYKHFKIGVSLWVCPKTMPKYKYTITFDFLLFNITFYIPKGK